MFADYKVDYACRIEGKDYKYNDQLGCSGNSIHECNNWLKLQYEYLKKADAVRKQVIFKRVRANYDNTGWQTLYEDGKIKYYEQLDLFEMTDKEN